MSQNNNDSFSSIVLCMAPPKPPYYILAKTGDASIIEIGGDGSYESVQILFEQLTDKFNATVEKHLDAGPNPNNDKEKGYWIIYIDGFEFFLMRERELGTAIWGPKDSGGEPTFFKLVDHFKAQKYSRFSSKCYRLRQEFLHIMSSFIPRGLRRS